MFLTRFYGHPAINLITQITYLDCKLNFREIFVIY